MAESSVGQTCDDDQVGGKRKADDDQVPGRVIHSCSPCQKRASETVADVYCKTCQQFQCLKCSKVHDKFDFMSGHDIDYRNLSNESINANGNSVDNSASYSLSISSDQETSIDNQEVDISGIDTCELHNKLYEIFCCDHQSLCCSFCAIESHKKCQEVMTIEKYVEKSRFEPSDFLVEIMTAAANAASVLKSYQASRRNVDQNAIDLPRVIGVAEDSVIKMINDAQAKVIADALKQKAEFIKKFDEQQLKCTRIIQHLDLMMRSFENIVDKESIDSIFIAYQQIQSVIEKYDKDLKAQQSEIFGADVCLQFDDVLSDLVQAKSDLITINVDKSFSREGPLPIIKPFKLEVIKSVDAREDTATKALSSYSAIDFLHDERIVAVDSTNNKCFVLDNKLTSLGFYKLDFSPVGVAAISNGDVAVTGASTGFFVRGGTILILNVDNANKISLQNTLKVDEMYGPVCTMNVATMIAGSLNDKIPVRMIDVQTGKTTNLDLQLPNKKFQADSFSLAYIRSRKTLVLSDKEENSVTLYVMNNDNTETRLVKDEMLKEPRGVCVGWNECVFVCCSATQCILQISTTAKVICYYPVDMNLPSRISSSKDGSKIVISGGGKEAKSIMLLSVKT